MKRWLVEARRYGLIGLSLGIAIGGCAVEMEAIDATEQEIVDVEHTPVERQSIGNCWLYSHATWIESMHLTATGGELDLSQSYWTYWHWFDQITGSLSRRQGPVEISTGGTWSTANGIVRRYGAMDEADFVSDDTIEEISWRQYNALERINESLSSGALASADARTDRELVRAELDAAWDLEPEVAAALDQAFGVDVAQTLAGYGTQRADVDGTPIVDPNAVPVAYIRRQASWDGSESFAPVNTSLSTAIRDWRTAYYSRGSRSLLQRVQKAVHQRQPVIVTWDVDFNAMETRDTELRGSFNLETLAAAGGPGRQGGHMVVLEDYEAVTAEFGLLAAGVTLDPDDPGDSAKLAAALRADTEIRFLRIKNSWGTLRPDRSDAPGFPGYHDLYLDYLNGPIPWCPNADRSEPDFPCPGSTVPLRYVILPPGF